MCPFRKKKEEGKKLFRHIENIYAYKAQHIFNIKKTTYIVFGIDHLQCLCVCVCLTYKSLFFFLYFYFCYFFFQILKVRSLQSSLLFVCVCKCVCNYVPTIHNEWFRLSFLITLCEVSRLVDIQLFIYNHVYIMFVFIMRINK